MGRRAERRTDNCVGVFHAYIISHTVSREFTGIRRIGYTILAQPTEKTWMPLN